jgi:hypothetical protein
MKLSEAYEAVLAFTEIASLTRLVCLCMRMVVQANVRKLIGVRGGGAVESESEGSLGGVGVGKNVPTPTSV